MINGLNQRKIIFLTNTLAGGGAEKQLLLTAAGLAERGHRCFIYGLAPRVAHPRYDELMTRCRSAGVDFVLPRRKILVVHIIFKLLLHMMRHPDIVVWSWGFRAELLRGILSRVVRRRGLVALRSASVDEVCRREKVVRFGSTSAACYVANSQRGLDLMARQLPFVRERGRVIYNALESSCWSRPPAALQRQNGCLRVLMMGNIFWAIKGYDIALAVAEQLMARKLPITVTIGGHQPRTEPSLEEAIQARNLASVISWAGKVSDPTSFLSTGDAFILLSRYEGTPNALLEAMAAGLPCVATDVGDLKQFAHAGSGVRIIPAGDVDAAVCELEWLLSHPSEARENGMASRAYCSAHFSETKMVDDSEAVLSVS